MSSDCCSCYKSVLLFGMPGSGKGTQGKLLGNIPGFYHLATGDIFRSLDKTSELGQIFVQYSSRGELVPDDLTIKLWQQHVERLISKGDFNPEKQLLLLDGMPRSMPQAQAISSHIQVLKIIHLATTDEDAMVTRMQLRATREGRHDDAKESVIRNRFQVYKNETQPVLDYYGAKLIANIDALGSPARVLQNVLAAIVPCQEANFGNALE